MSPRKRRTVQSAEDARAALRRRIIANRAVAGGVLLLALLATFFWFRSTAKREHALRMTAGDPLSHRHQLAKILCEEAEEHGLQIELVPTSGSQAALELIASGDLDMALVLGDMDVPDEMIREVAVLYSEPLHLFVKADLVDGGLEGLRGKRLSLGANGATSQKLARQLLKFVGLEAGTDFQEDDLTYSQMATLPADQLPDGIFAITALPWVEVGEHLVQKKGYRLMEIPFADAIALRDPSLHDMIIPAYSYGVTPPVPPRPLHTLGHPLLMVANRDTPEAAVESLMRVVFEGDFGRRAKLPGLDPTGIDRARDFPLHAGALKYLHRNRPLITSELINRIENMRSFLVSAVLAMFLFWRWQKRRQMIGFEEYIDAVSEIEIEALNLDRNNQLDPAVLRSMRNRLVVIKSEALERHAEGRLNGEEQMSGFLTHVSDVRGYLESLSASAPHAPAAEHASNGSTSTDAATPEHSSTTTENLL